MNAQTGVPVTAAPANKIVINNYGTVNITYNNPSRLVPGTEDVYFPSDSEEEDESELQYSSSERPGTSSYSGSVDDSTGPRDIGSDDFLLPSSDESEEDAPEPAPKRSKVKASSHCALGDSDDCSRLVPGTKDVWLPSDESEDEQEEPLLNVSTEQPFAHSISENRAISCVLPVTKHVFHTSDSEDEDACEHCYNQFQSKATDELKGRLVKQLDLQDVAVSDYRNRVLALKKEIQGNVTYRRSREMMLQTKQEYNKHKDTIPNSIGWKESKCSYVKFFTHLKIEVCSYSLYDAQRVLALYQEVHTSHDVLRNNKLDRIARLSKQRSKNIATFGNNRHLERDVAFEIKALEKTNAGSRLGLQIVVLPDGARADILFRFKEMAQGTFYAIQIKTTAAMRIRITPHGHKQGCWRFQNCLGYNGMLILCACKSDGRVWIRSGTNVGKKTILIHASTHHLRNGEVVPLIHSDVVDYRTKCGQFALVNILHGVHNEKTSHASQTWECVLKTTFEYETDRLGNNQKVERDGIYMYARLVHGGVKEWRLHNDMPELFCSDNTIISFPREQNGKIDVFIHLSGKGKIISCQFKTAKRLHYSQIFHVGLETNYGHDNGKSIRRNTYTDEIDIFIVCQPKKIETDDELVWVVPSSYLLRKGAIAKHGSNTFPQMGHFCVVSGSTKKKSKWSETLDFRVRCFADLERILSAENLLARA